MLLSEAKEIADEFLDMIYKYCIRCEIAGSVRRGKEYPKDIEIVAVPDSYKLERYFKEEGKSHMKFLKNGRKYKQILFRDIKIDLFLTEENNWGIIFLSRTGSARFTASILSQWKKFTKGGRSTNGFLTDTNGKQYMFKEEKDIFEHLGLEYVEPKDRS